MMALSIFNFFRQFIILLLVSTNFVISQEVVSDAQATQGWLMRCFMLGQNLKNTAESTDCNNLQPLAEFAKVQELQSKCLNFYKLGCSMDQRRKFCQIGVNEVIKAMPKSDEIKCSSFVFPRDETHLAFDCCIMCKQGITESKKEDECTLSNTQELPQIALTQCCLRGRRSQNITETEVEAEKVTEESNSTSSTSTTALPLEEVENNTLIETFNVTESTATIPMIINTTIEPTLEKISSTSLAPEPVVTEIITSTLSSNKISTDETTNDGLTTVSSTTLPNERSVISTTNAPKSCEKGFKLSDSDECEDIDECKDVGTCPNSICFNRPGSFKCCEEGQILDSDGDCVYIDYCERKPCFQSEKDKHLCVNYFTGRECIDLILDDYQDFNSKMLKVKDEKNKKIPTYLEISRKTVYFDGKEGDYKGYKLVKLTLKEKYNCDWDLKLEEVWAPNERNKVSEDQFDTSMSSPNVFIMRLNGIVKPQSFGISITCNLDKFPYYRNTIYFTFQPRDILI